MANQSDPVEKNPAPGPAPPVVPATLPPTPESLIALRVTLGRCIVGSFVALFITIPILIGWMLNLLKITDPKNAATFDRVALVGSLQVGLGMFLGYVITFFGIAMSWLGVQEAFSLAARGKAHEGLEGRLAFSSAGPGLLYAALGIALIWGSLYKRIEIKDSTHNFYSESTSKPPPTDNVRERTDDPGSLPGQK